MFDKLRYAWGQLSLFFFLWRLLMDSRTPADGCVFFAMYGGENDLTIFHTIKGEELLDILKESEIDIADLAGQANIIEVCSALLNEHFAIPDPEVIWRGAFVRELFWELISFTA